MKKVKEILTIVFFTAIALFACNGGFGQTYSAPQGTVSNKPYAPAQAVPTDSRSYFYDGTNFIWRPYQSTTEVLSYLNLTKYRVGHFPIIVNPTGTLNGDGSFTGGTIVEYWFKNGTANGNLVPKYDTTKAWQQALIDSSTNIRTTLNTKQSAITLTTTGISGAATLVGSTLNIPQYSSGGGSVSLTGSASTGIIVTPSPITGTGTIKNDTTVVTTLARLKKVADSLAAIQDTVDVVNIMTAGTTISYGNSTADTVWMKRFKAGTNITITQNSDSSITIYSDNLYSIDGLLSANRLVDLNSKSLSIWNPATDGGYSLYSSGTGGGLSQGWRKISPSKQHYFSADQTSTTLNAVGTNTGYVSAYEDSIVLFNNNGNYRVRALGSAAIASNVKPVMWDSSSSRLYYGVTQSSAHTSSPTFYYVTNVSTTSSAELTYQIIGDVVHVYGKVVIVSSGVGAGELDMSFPVTTTIANDYDVAGTGASAANPTEGLEISGDVANNRIKLKTIFLGAGTRTFFVTFMFKYLPS